MFIELIYHPLESQRTIGFLRLSTQPKAYGVIITVEFVYLNFSHSAYGANSLDGIIFKEVPWETISMH